jgi:hypothetical protein
MSDLQNAGYDRSTKISNTSFENLVKFDYLKPTVTNQNYFHEEIRDRLSSSNAQFDSVKNLLSSILLSRNQKSEVNNTVAWLFFLCCVSVELTERHRV